MRAKLSARSTRPILVLLVLLAGALACTECGPSPDQLPAAAPTPTTVTEAPTPTSKPQITTIEGPEGLVLQLEGQALAEIAVPVVEVLRDDGFSTAGSPFGAVGPEFRIGFGEGDQIGGMVLKVPFALLPELNNPPDPWRFAGWARPDRGYPSMVGVLIDQEQEFVSLPIVGSGMYQILKIVGPQAVDVQPVIWEPLAVPSYWQATCGWCSTTALTDVSGYHEGTWPSGGFGGAWGESSNWYLAGLGGQSCPKGFFFHWLLEAGGYATPDDVKQSFSNGNAEVIIWNWKAAKIDEWDLELLPDLDDPFMGFLTEEYINSRLEYAASLFQFFHAYVETNVWGLNGDRRPVAWGSALAGHSRAITGSNGQDLFFNNPSSGSLNDSKSWEAYQQEIIASILPDAEDTEIIDTAVFYAEPRPAGERRGVLWLTPRLDNWEGSIILRRGEDGAPAAYWHWDGAEAHNYGYYFEDLIGDLPADPEFDVQFKAFTPDDVVEYGYGIRSIADATYDFKVKAELNSEAGLVGTIVLPDQTATVGAGGRADFYPAGTIPIGNLAPGLYRLKFTLSMGGTVQDVKYVFFRLAERGYVLDIPIGTLKKNALCRRGPGTAYGIVTGFEAPMELTVVGTNAERTWGYFEAVLNAAKVRCWISLDLVEMYPAPDIPILGAPALEAPPVCASDVTRDVCNAAGGTWKFTLAGAGYCDCP